MLKKFAWIAALFVALAMVFTGCPETQMGAQDDGSEPKQAVDLVIEGEDIVLEAVGNNWEKVTIDGNKVSFDNSNASGDGFSYVFPAEALAGYGEVQFFFKVVSIEKGKPGFLIKNTDMSNYTGIVDNEDPEYQMCDTDDNRAHPKGLGKGFSFTEGMEFDTTMPYNQAGAKRTLKLGSFKNSTIAFFHQMYNPSGNGDVKYTIEVVKIVFPGGGEPPVEIEEPPVYEGKTAVMLLDGSIVDYDPSVKGEVGMTIDEKTGLVSMTENSVLYYKFPTSVKLGSSADGAEVDIDIEAEYDYVEFEYTISDVEKGKKADGTDSDGNFKARVREYQNTNAYIGFAGASEWPNLGLAGARTFRTQTWGAQGSGGIAINYNWNDRNADGALSLKVKITKVTFTKGNRVTIQFINNEGPAFYKAVSFLGVNGPRAAIPSAADVGARTGYTFIGWSPDPTAAIPVVIGATSDISASGTYTPLWYTGAPANVAITDSDVIHGWLFSDNPGNTATMNLANPDSCEMPASGPQIWGFQLGEASSIWMAYDTLVITMTISGTTANNASTNIKASSGTNPWGSDYNAGDRTGMSSQFTSIADGELVLTVPISSFPGGTFACQRNNGGYKFKITKIELKLPS